MRSVYPDPRRRWKGHHETGAPPGPAYRLRHRLLRARRERPRRRRPTEQRDELAPLYPNHVIPRACAVWVRLKRTLAALAHFARCLGRRRPFPPTGRGRDDRRAIKRARATKAEVEVPLQ